MKKIIFCLSFLMIALVSCKKDHEVAPAASDAITMNASSSPEFCGEPTHVDFMAGQHMTAGSITVTNDATNLFVTFFTTNGWEMQQTHLYVGDCNAIPVNASGSPKIGLFPYKSAHAPRVTAYTYTIPLTSLPPCFCIAAHAEVLLIDQGGNVIKAETAWGSGDPFNGGSWAMKFNYCKQDCTIDNEVCYQEETAWANGTRFIEVGNWATYVSYAGAENEVTLFAGQTLEAGKVFLAAPQNGFVTISITLNEGWTLQDVAEPVKIQGYDTAPSGNPSPGLFTTYKGTELVVVVPQYNFYGIHLDVRKAVACE